MDGRGDKAYETLLKIIPDGEENPSDHSGAEPYVLTNMFFGPANPRAGQTQFSWVTGSAGWVYRAITQYMLGFYPEYEGIRIQPALPKSWKSASLVRYYQGCTYEIDIRNEHGAKMPVSVTVDGVPQSGNVIPAFNDGQKHVIYVEV